jgi:hypothetical protein
MNRLAEEPDILTLAEKLGVGAADDSVVAILDLCRSRIDRWVGEEGGIGSIDDLERLVTEKVQMVFEEIRDDRDFDRIKEVYARGKKEGVFAAMRSKFDDDRNPIYGALVRRKNADSDSPDRYVAVIDCRGEKLSRRFFTRWHEIAHRLTTDADEPVYRSKHDPIEQMMDRIASHIGFYEPLLGPSFDREVPEGRKLSLDAVENIRRDAFPDASFQSTLFACHRRYAEPAVYVEATPALKVEHRRDITQGAQWLFDDCRPVPQLRAVMVIQNDAAKERGLFIAPNMRVPESSLIHRVYVDESLSDRESIENLCDWEHSGGKRLAKQEVRIEAKRMRDRVIALVQIPSPRKSSNT